MCSKTALGNFKLDLHNTISNAKRFASHLAGCRVTRDNVNIVAIDLNSKRIFRFRKIRVDGCAGHARKNGKRG